MKSLRNYNIAVLFYRRYSVCAYTVYFIAKIRMNLRETLKKYIETLFHFLEDKGFKKSYRQINFEGGFRYEKDDFHITINYCCYKEIQAWFDIYYKTWDNEPIIKHLYIKDEYYKLKFHNYDKLNCKEQLDLVAEYLSKYVEDIVDANIHSKQDYIIKANNLNLL